jgi:hypothetical protein
MENEELNPQADHLCGEFITDGLLDCGWGDLTQDQLLKNIGERLMFISFFAYRGHKPYKLLLSKILEMISRPSIPNSLIKVPPSVARAMQVRVNMSVLSDYVKPARSSSSNSILQGPVEIDTSARRDDFYYLVEKHRKKGMTLRSLAVRILIDVLQGNGIETIDERVIARDLNYCRRWEAQHPDLITIVLRVRGDEEGLPLVPCSINRCTHNAALTDSRMRP